MIRINFTPEEQGRLYHNFIYEPHPQTRKKNFILFLKSTGLSHGEISRLGRISGPTLVSYLKEYVEKGAGSFRTLKWKGAKNELSGFSDTIRSDFEKVPPGTVKEARERILGLTGISRSPTQVRLFMKSLGFSYLKTGSVPGNGKGDSAAKERERQEFKKKSCCPVWQKL